MLKTNSFTICRGVASAAPVGSTLIITAPRSALKRRDERAHKTSGASAAAEFLFACLAPRAPLDFAAVSNPYESPVESAVATPAPAELSRYGVLAFLCSLAFILNLDRVCNGKAVKPICDDLGLSLSEMGDVLGAFVVAYGLFEVPTGHWGDRYGSRGVLTRIVIWWSAFTILTGAATGYWMFIGTRFLIGAGEARAYPNVARVLARWFPAKQRASAQGLVITSAQFGGAISPALAAYLIEYAGRRSAFANYG